MAASTARACDSAGQQAHGCIREEEGGGRQKVERAAEGRDGPIAARSLPMPPPTVVLLGCAREGAKRAGNARNTAAAIVLLCTPPVLLPHVTEAGHLTKEAQLRADAALLLHAAATRVQAAAASAALLPLAARLLLLLLLRRGVDRALLLLLLLVGQGGWRQRRVASLACGRRPRGQRWLAWKRQWRSHGQRGRPGGLVARLLEEELRPSVWRLLQHLHRVLSHSLKTKVRKNEGMGRAGG